MGIPPRMPAQTFAIPQDRLTDVGETRAARAPKYLCSTSDSATTAFPNVRGTCGMTRRTKAEPRTDGRSTCATCGCQSETCTAMSACPNAIEYAMLAPTTANATGACRHDRAQTSAIATAAAMAYVVADGCASRRT